MIKPKREVRCKLRQDGYRLEFYSMASPCEILVDSSDQRLAKHLGEIAAKEAWRIEDKYSRYLSTSVCSRINRDAGSITNIDDETFQLLKFSEDCFQMSDGLFDITSGILRKVWRFDCSDNIPAQNEISKLLPYIGWKQTTLTPSTFSMKAGMELDFGGLGKEYAVDRALQQITGHLKSKQLNIPVLVNFGGDLAVNKSRMNDEPWQVGIESPTGNGKEEDKIRTMVVTISKGAIATSGDARKYLFKDGKRYSHILNVKTGWPIKNAPHSMTVAAPKCIQAGFIATLASLQGAKAESFLQEQDIPHWIIR